MSARNVATAEQSANVLYVSGVHHGRPVGKGFYLDRGGRLQKKVMPRLPGAAVNLALHNFADYCEFRDSLGSQHILTCGTWEPGLPDGTLVVYAGRDDEPGKVCATNDYLAFRGAPTVLRIDTDIKEPDEVAALYPERPRIADTLEGQRELLLEVAPYLRRVAMRISDSSSAMIFNGEKMIKGPGGLRTELPIDTGIAVPTVLEDLHERCWAAGYGWCFVDRAGRVQERSLVDLVMARPHQPDFIAPYLWAPLTRKPRVKVYTGELLQAKDVMPNAAVVARAQACKRLAVEMLRPAANQQLGVAKVWRVEELVAAGTGREEAERTVAMAFDSGSLLSAHLIHFKSGPVTVAELLANGAKYDQQRCRDPIEPSYRDGDYCAVFLWRDGRQPVVLSYAHCQKWYRLYLTTEAAVDGMTRGLAMKPRAQRAADARQRVDAMMGVRR